MTDKIADLRNIVFVAHGERKETRDKYVRIDHPYKNPALDEKMLVCKKGDTGPENTYFLNINP